MAARKEKNRKQQEEYLAARKEQGKGADKNPWDKVVSHVDIKEGGYKGTKDISRMKAVMSGRKDDFLHGKTKLE